MRSVIATEVIPNILHARRGGRVLGQLRDTPKTLRTTTPTHFLKLSSALR